MKNKKKFLIATAMLACALTCSGIATTVAFADKVEIESENRIYYGETINLDNIALYEQKEITLSECDLNNPLIEFCVTPSQNGTSTLYTPDFEKLNITLFNPTDPEKQMIISLAPHYKLNNNVVGGVDEYFMSVLALGGTQSLGAEWVGGQEKNANVLATKWSGNIVQTFDGCVRYDKYIDEYGNPVPVGGNRAIRLFYDATENALYTDVGEMGENRQYTYTDNGVTKYRWRIRDFDKTDYKNMWGGDITTTWNGFTQDETLKVGITFDDVVDGKEPSILVSKLAGKTLLKSPIVVSTLSKGQTGLAYPIPAPIYYDEENYAEKDFISVSGQYEIKKKTESGDETVQAYTAFSAGSSFTPTTAGDYLITYKAEGVTNSITISVEDNLAGTQLLPNALPDSCYINDTLDLGADCEYPSQAYKPSVTLELFKNGSFVNEWNVGETLEYTFSENGKYTLIYTSIDYLGRLSRVERFIDVRRYYISWKNGITDNVAVPYGTAVQTPALSDMEIFDIPFDTTVQAQACVITVSYNGGNYQALSEQDFSKQGEYAIKYQIKYDAYGEESLETVRRIFIYNAELDEITVKGLPYGTKLVKEIENPVEIHLKALKGKEIVVPYYYFGGAMTKVTFVTPSADETDITLDLEKGDWAFTPQANGVYEITAFVENEYYRVVKLLKIDVRNQWIAFSNTDELTLSLGENINDYAPVCKDFYGNVITDYKTELYYMGEKVEDTSGRLEKLGLYKVVYSYEKDGEIAKAERTITTFDNGEPTLKLKEAKTSVFKNQTVYLAEFEVSDDSNLAPKIIVTVTCNGEEVNVYNNSFKATQTGKYVVTYYAVDTQGNSVTAQYVVTVKGYTGLLVGIGIGVVVLSAGIATCIILSKKKNKKGEN